MPKLTSWIYPIAMFVSGFAWWALTGELQTALFPWGASTGWCMFQLFDMLVERRFERRTKETEKLLSQLVELLDRIERIGGPGIRSEPTPGCECEVCRAKRFRKRSGGPEGRKKKKQEKR